MLHIDVAIKPPFRRQFILRTPRKHQVIISLYDKQTIMTSNIHGFIIHVKIIQWLIISTVLGKDEELDLEENMIHPTAQRCCCPTYHASRKVTHSAI